MVSDCSDNIVYAILSFYNIMQSFVLAAFDNRSSPLEIIHLVVDEEIISEELK